MGRTWKLLLRGAEYQVNSRGYGVAAVAAHKEILFAGSDEGQVYASPDNGSQWTRLMTGLPMGFVSGLAVGDSSLYVMVENKGVWRRSLAGVARQELPSLPGHSGKKPRGKRRHPLPGEERFW
jgi:outer membrane protein assembly factor BamB